MHFTGDYRLTPSHHDYLELTLLFEGRGVFTVENRQYSVSAGDVLLIASREFHLLEANQGCSVKAASIHFMPELLHAPGGPAIDLEYLRPFRYRTTAFSHQIAPGALPPNLVLDRIRRMHAEIQAGGEGYPLAVKTYLADILLEVARHHRRLGGEVVPQNRRVRDFERLREVFDHVRKSCAERILLSEVARMAHMTPNYFCRFFRAVSGSTFSEYVQRVRVDLATDLLAGGVMSVTDVAYAAGFSSHSYFDRVFKQLKGVTPQEYRSQLQAQPAEEDDDGEGIRSGSNGSCPAALADRVETSGK